jgi:hypothetical protein
MVAVVALLLPRPLHAWDASGHQVVARIAWDAMTATARQRAVALLQAAPADACLRELFPADARPLELRKREFFVAASTWPDLVRPQNPGDTRPCVRFHRRDWHFINYFWSGVSGGTGGQQPRDRPDIPAPADNVVERLRVFRPFVACSTVACGTRREDRALALAWILHLVGDVHQPLHTSARVTSEPGEQAGDQGGNLFKLQVLSNDDRLSLHSFWDGSVGRSFPRQPGESDQAYVNRAAAAIVAKHPRSQLAAELKAADVPAWSQEGLATCKDALYPGTLARNHAPSAAYQDRASVTADKAMALAGYRLADLLGRMLGP